MYVCMHACACIHACIYTKDKTSSIASQFTMKKWPSCPANMKCRVTCYDASLWQLIKLNIYVNLHSMSQML